MVGLDVTEHGNIDCCMCIIYFDINRVLSRNTVISIRLSALQYRPTCCSGYSGSFPNCQRKNDHVINNIYDRCVAIAICSPSCANGRICIAPNTCNCVAGWTGQYCTNGK